MFTGNLYIHTYIYVYMNCWLCFKQFCRNFLLFDCCESASQTVNLIIWNVYIYFSSMLLLFYDFFDYRSLNFNIFKPISFLLYYFCVVSLVNAFLTLGLLNYSIIVLFNLRTKLKQGEIILNTQCES